MCEELWLTSRLKNAMRITAEDLTRIQQRSHVWPSCPDSGGEYKCTNCGALKNEVIKPPFNYFSCGEIYARRRDGTLPNPKEEKAMPLDPPRPHGGSRYDKAIRSSRDPKVTVIIDVYSIAEAYKLSLAMGHVIKKCLMPGERGTKSELQDLKEAHWTLGRIIADKEAYIAATTDKVTE